MLDRVQTTIRLPEELREAVQRQAEKEGQSFNAMVILLILEGLSLRDRIRKQQSPDA